MDEARLAALEIRVAQLEYDKIRVRTWSEVIYDLDMLVCDAQVSGISDALLKLAAEGLDDGR